MEGVRRASSRGRAIGAVARSTPVFAPGSSDGVNRSPSDSRHDVAVALQSFLIDFGDVERVPNLCAVTATDENDALALVRGAYGQAPSPVSIEALSAAAIQDRIGHFDFGVPVVRGIWFPHISNP